MFPREDDHLKLRVVDEILPVILSDNVKARVLGRDGRYQRAEALPDAPRSRCQLVLQEVAREAAREGEVAARRLLPEPGPVPEREVESHPQPKERLLQRT
jgi:hypothetical protein